MLEIFNKLIGEKKEYREMVRRVKQLPDDYQFVYDKIQKYMWSFCAGDGYDMLKIHYELIELFEVGAANHQHVLEITGEDVATFSDQLLLNAKTYTENWHDKLNREIKNKFDK